MGFLLGYAAGSAAAASAADQQVVAIASDKNDVIACREWSEETCTDGDFRRGITPAQYAAKHGYKYIHKVGVVITGRGKYITIEVSK